MVNVRSSAAVAAVLTAVALPAGAAATVQTSESYKELQRQIGTGQVVRATINKPPHDVKVVLKDGSIQTALYPSHEEKTLEADLRSHGARVKFAKHKKKAAKTAHHHLRYIAGGILAALIVIGGGAYVVTRRRETSGGPGSEPPAASN